jgi:hypothetical protein
LIQISLLVDSLFVPIRVIRNTRNPLRQAIRQINAQGIGVHIQEASKRPLEDPEIPALTPNPDPGALRLGHDRNVKGLIAPVEAFAGDDHDADVQTDLLYAAHEHAGQVEIPRLGEHVNSEIVCRHIV